VNLILFESHEVSPQFEAEVSGPRAEHLIRVLKVAPGDEVRIGIINGRRGTGTVVSTSEHSVQLQCALEEAIPPTPRVDLLLALPRPKVLRRLWAQLAAIGVGRILLANAARVERNYFDTHVLSPDCYRPLLLEGLQQARDTRLPQVSIHRQLKILIEDHLATAVGGGARLVATPSATVRVHEVVDGRPADRILLAIGPEGGWTSFETGLFVNHGFQPVGMGSRTLRTDTACIALLALVHSALAARTP
jgi:16S rRNA (uracil1498-N3)-methyltransferase